MNNSRFVQEFEAITGHPPLPWQEMLYQRFEGGAAEIPSCCEIPTGLGKTSIIAIWLIALGHHPGHLPRRLVYVVNRRTVVDQTTDEVEKLRQNLLARPELKQLRQNSKGLAISTLRGQFADNQEWSADPSRPAVVCGTVDMIGSRLLFNGYRIGFRSRPLHAGFLGQDVLLVHDEAHLEPAFQRLVEAIADEQQREKNRPESCRHLIPMPDLRVMALSATAREEKKERADSGAGHILMLTDKDLEHPVVRKRFHARKKLLLHPIESVDDSGRERKPAEIDKELIEKIVELAKSLQDSGGAVLVFVRKVEHVEKIMKKLPHDVTEQLTGTLRGLERDNLVHVPLFQRFLAKADQNHNIDPPAGTVYLVCTSAGEVGVNISADHMVCDLSTFDSMVQRFGRVNRFGERTDTEIHVVHQVTFGKKDRKGKWKKNELDHCLENTLGLLEQLEEDASPLAIEQLEASDCLRAFAPEPTILPVSDILFDNWSCTTIHHVPMPGRPSVEPYLHGVTEWDPPQTEVAWREEVSVICGDLLDQNQPADLLDSFPLKPHELLRDRSDRVFKEIGKIGKRCPDAPVWLISDDGSVKILTVGALAVKDMKDRIKNRTVLLPPEAGGLRDGMLVGKSAYHSDAEYDVADKGTDELNRQRRLRIWGDTEAGDGMALIRVIDTEPDKEDFESPENEEEGSAQTGVDRRFWYWYVLPRNIDDVTPASIRPVTLAGHTESVVAAMERIFTGLHLPENIKAALILAAQLHDLGKRRKLFQLSLGNPTPETWFAKSGKPEDGPRWFPWRISRYRHEFGSVLDALDQNQEFFRELEKLDDEMRDLVLHVIAAHHGRARPHFPEDEAFDPESWSTGREQEEAASIMRRFALLQRRYGRWGLAYLESLLRAADWEASANR